MHRVVDSKASLAFGDGALPSTQVTLFGGKGGVGKSGGPRRRGFESFRTAFFLKIWKFLAGCCFLFLGSSSLSLSIVAKIGMPAILIYRCMSIRDFVSNICQYSGNRQVRVVWRSLYSMYAAYKLVSNRKKINTRLRIRIVQRIHPRLGIDTWYMLVFIDIQASVEVE